MSYLSLNGLSSLCIRETKGGDYHRITYHGSHINLYGVFLSCDVVRIVGLGTFFKVYVQGSCINELRSIDESLHHLKEYIPIVTRDMEGVYLTVGRTTTTTTIARDHQKGALIGGLYLNITDLRRYSSGIRPLIFLVHGHHRPFADYSQPLSPRARTQTTGDRLRLARCSVAQAPSREIQGDLPQSLLLEDDS
jgi:hypothetical protein